MFYIVTVFANLKKIFTTNIINYECNNSSSKNNEQNVS